MNFQEFGRAVNHRGHSNGSIDSIEVQPFVYEEDNVINTVVFEFDGLILTLFDDGTYSLENN